MEPIVNDLREAVRRGEWEAVRLILHPYVHRACQDGTVLRGRNQVLALLAEAPVLEPPASVELRDGQIYRWSR